MDEKINEQEHIDDGITLVELLNAIKQNIILLLAIAIAVVGAGVFYTWFLVTPMYTSSVNIQISNVNESVATVTQIRSNVKEIVKYTDIIREVIIDLNIPYTDIEATAKSISKRISSSDLGSSSAITVSYQDKDPVRASKIVVKIAEETARRVNIPKGDVGSLAFSGETLSLMNRPNENPNQAPSSPNKILNLAISVILGGIIGVVIVILKEQFSGYFKTKRDVERFTKISVIAAIPARDGVKSGE